MDAELPAVGQRYRVVDGRTVSEAFSPRAPGPGEVLVGVAGSALGAAPGAEVAGQVLATGEAAAEWLGRRVVVPRLLPCGECDRCRRGRTASCRAPATRGPVQSLETVPARFLLSVEPPLWPEGGALWALALLADAASSPYAALCRAQVGPSDVVAVVGGGPRGRLAGALAIAKGAAAVVVDADPARAREARRTPGLEALDPGSALEPSGGGALDELLSRIAALPRETTLSTPELRIVETSGTAAGRRLAIGLGARAGATVVLLGDGGDDAVEVPVGELCQREGQLLGSGPCHPDLLPELCALVVRGQLRLEDHCVAVPFTRLAEAIAEHRGGRLLPLPIATPAAVD